MYNTEENKKIWLEKVENIMRAGGKSKRTFNNYKVHINRFLNFFDKDINFQNILEDDIMSYIKKEYIDLDRASDTINVAICSIRFLYSICFKIELNRKLLPNVKREQLIPTILPKKDFIKIFNETENIKYKCWLLLGYCSGLRTEEIVTIKIENIYADEHKIKVYGKRKKERYTILPDVTIKYLRLYCKYNHITKKTGYLFITKRNKKHNCSSCPTEFFTRIQKKYNLPKTITFHSLRHSFATYYLINGGDLITLQSIMGHNSIQTTRRYIHYSLDYNNLKGINYV